MMMSSGDEQSRRSGRRPGPSRARDEILAAARRRFGEVGYGAASVREIARAAGVDSALVHHYFGTKQGLFQAALALPVSPGEVVAIAFAEGHEHAGSRLLSQLMASFEEEQGRAQFASLLRSAVTGERPLTLFQEFIQHVIGELEPRMPGRRRRERAALLMSTIAGMFLYRYLVPAEPLATMPAQQVVRRLAPVIQGYIDDAPPAKGAMS